MLLLPLLLFGNGVREPTGLLLALDGLLFAPDIFEMPPFGFRRGEVSRDAVELPGAARGVHPTASCTDAAAADDDCDGWE